MNGWTCQASGPIDHNNCNDIQPFINNFPHSPRRRIHTSFLSQLRPSLILLQIAGIYPRSLPYAQHRHGGYRKVHFVKSVSFLLLSTIYMAINLSIIGIVLWVIKEYLTYFGLWHAETVASIITGMKPLQSTMNLFIFALMRNRHKKLLRYLDMLNASFNEDFGLSPNMRHINRSLILFTTVLFAVTFCLRTVEYLLTVFLTPNYMTQNSDYNWLFEYVPFILLPMFTVWQLLPLIYFSTINTIIRFWIGVLIKAIYADPSFERHTMTTYFDQFCQIAHAQKKMGTVFSMFILFNLGVVVITLCLTVYFITQTNSIVPDGSDVVFYFNFVWSTLQIIILVTYLVGICIIGFKTNEKSRKVLEAALYTKPTNQQERFQIFCLSEKIHLQYGWGIAVWRGFLIERGLLFTIVGLIVTWALVLLRMKPQENCSFIDAIPESVRTATNATTTGLRLMGGLIFSHVDNASDVFINETMNMSLP